MKLPSKLTRIYILGLATAGLVGVSCASATHSPWGLGISLPLSWLVGVEVARNIEWQRNIEHMMKRVKELEKEISK